MAKLTPAKLAQLTTLMHQAIDADQLTICRESTVHENFNETRLLPSQVAFSCQSNRIAIHLSDAAILNLSAA